MRMRLKMGMYKSSTSAQPLPYIIQVVLQQKSNQQDCQAATQNVCLLLHMCRHVPCRSWWITLSARGSRTIQMQMTSKMSTRLRWPRLSRCAGCERRSLVSMLSVTPAATQALVWQGVLACTHMSVQMLNVACAERTAMLGTKSLKELNTIHHNSTAVLALYTASQRLPCWPVQQQTDHQAVQAGSDFLGSCCFFSCCPADA